MSKHEKIVENKDKEISELTDKLSSKTLSWYESTKLMAEAASDQTDDLNDHSDILKGQIIELDEYLSKNK